MRRFELTEGTSDKFWEIDPAADGLGFTVRYGRRGTAGQTQDKIFDTAAKATAEIDKLIREKVKKGYAEVSGGRAEEAVHAPPTPSAPGVEPAREAQAEPEGAEPAPAPKAATVATELPDEDRIFWDATLARRAWAVRGHPLPAGQQMPSVEAIVKELGRSYWIRGVAGEWESYAKREVTVAEAVRMYEASHRASIDLDAARQGVLFALRVIAHGGATTQGASGFGRLRTMIANLPEDEYREAAAEAERLMAGAPTTLVATFCFLFPTEPGALSWVAANPRVSDHTLPMLPTAPQPGALPAWHVFHSYGETASLAVSLVHRYGLDALPALLAVNCNGAEDLRERATLFARIGSDEAFAKLLEDLDDRNVVRSLPDACAVQPARALRLLSAVTGRSADLARLRLREVAASHPELVPLVAEQLPGEHRKVLLEAATVREVVAAPAEAVPEVLRQPPWERKGAAAKRPVVEVGPIPVETVLRWDEAQRMAALREHVWDESYRLRQLPAWIANLEQRLAAAEQAQRAGQVLGHWETPAQLRQLLAHQRSEFEQLNRPIDEVAAGWISTGRVSLSLMARMPARLVRAAVSTVPDPVWIPNPVLWRHVLAVHGAATADWVATAVVQAPPKSVGEVLMIGSTRLALHAAKAFASKGGVKEGQRWLLAHPDHAVAGLIPVALGKLGKDRDVAERALRFLDGRGHGDLIRGHAASAGQAVQTAIAAVLALDPLSLFPTKRPKLPDWLVLSALPPIELSSGEGALPEAAVNALLTMLAFTKADEPYAGIDHVKATCTRQSLGQFAWALCQQWLASGAPSAHGWAYQALGAIGDDECARRLSPLIRVWPRESAGARAVSGLDILVNIGSDVSLMHLNRLAQTAPTKGLKTRAQERIADLAEARGLTMEELADRLVPDLGLDEDGSLWFDFGPRRFQVGFDELLAPFVKDESGARLRALPKPNSKDDPELSKGAGDRWKALKKDASDAAKTQIRRIELAMGGRRRWGTDTFRSCFVDHPLMGHVARRLVWATYDEAGAVTGTFRVAEDRSFADVNDDLWELPEAAIIGIPHVLELAAGVAGSWGDVLADYELLQPFAQLGRDTYTISDAERGGTELATVEGVVCHFGKILSLEARGWNKGEPMDAGVVHEMIKPLGEGRYAFLNLTEGLWMSLVTETPDQPLGKVTVHNSPNSWNQGDRLALSAVDPIELSELIRDLESLRS